MRSTILFAAVALVAAAAVAQRSEPPVTPTEAEIAYAPAEPADSQGHFLDLYVPAGAEGSELAARPKRL